MDNWDEIKTAYQVARLETVSGGSRNDLSRTNCIPSTAAGSKWALSRRSRHFAQMSALRTERPLQIGIPMTGYNKSIVRSH